MFVSRRVAAPARTVVLWSAAALVLLSTLMALTATASAADRTFGLRNTFSGKGGFALIGNTSLTCPNPAGDANCAGAQAGTNTQGNDNFAMANVDLDGATDASFNSTSATLSLPAGAKVESAALYTVGRAAAASTEAEKRATKIKASGSATTGTYANVTASVYDVATANGTDTTYYSTYTDVSQIVKDGFAANNNVYTVANVEGATAANGLAGWSLAVIYSDANSPTQNIGVYDGVQTILTNQTRTINIAGLRPPTTGTVTGTFGFMGFEGDRGIVGDSLTLGGQAISNNANPQNNVLNSTVANALGANVTARNPAFVNQLGVDVDNFTLPANAVPAGATNVNAVFGSTGEAQSFVNAFVIATLGETTPPDTNLISGTPDGATVQNPTYSFDSPGTMDLKGFQCSVDSTTDYNPCTSPYTPTLTEGNHTIRIRAVDLNDNADPTPIVRTVTIDRTAPTTVVNSGPTPGSGNGAFATSTTPSFTFSGAGVNGTYACAVDGVDPVPCNGGTFTTGTLGQGAHFFTVTATDQAGNVGNTVTKNFTVDSVAPITAIATGPNEGTTSNNASPTFTFTGAGTNGTYQCKLDNAAAVACNGGSFTPPAPLGTGPHQFTVTATDAAGNVGNTVVRNFNVDVTAPETTITSPVSGTTVGTTTPTIVSTSSEPTGATFFCSVDSAGFVPCSNNYTLPTPLGSGSHTVRVYSVDQYGNVDASPASTTFTVDTSFPETTIDTGIPTGTFTNVRTQSFTFSSDTASATFECKVDAAPYAPCSGTQTLTNLADGEHTFSVRATNTFGRTDQSPASRTFTVDTQAPDTAIQTGPAQNSTSNSTTATFTFNGAGTNGTYQCKLDQDPVQACNGGSFSANNLADGSHTFTVVGTDRAGNVDPNPEVRTFNVDTSKPNTTITAPANGSVIATGTPTITSTSTKSPSTFTCSIDNGAYFPCSAAYTIPANNALGNGQHTVRVIATDQYGNADPSPAETIFTVDTTTPDTTITVGVPNNVTNNTTPTFQFTGAPANGSYECKVDNGNFAPCASAYTVAPALNEGSHTFQVRALSVAGTPDGSPASQTFTVDLTAPETTINTGPNDGATTTVRVNTFTFSGAGTNGKYTCQVDTNPVSVCDSGSFTTGSLSDGSHTFRVFATDQAGNVDTSSAIRTFTVDATPPDTTITAPFNGSTVGTATPTITSTSTKTPSSFMCKVDNLAYVSCGASYQTPTLTQGQHTVLVYAIDQNGLVDGSPASTTFTVDLAQPDTVITLGVADGGATNDNTPRFEFNATKPSSTLECSIDGGTYAPCMSPKDLGPFEDGTHTFEVRSIDQFGVTDPSPAKRTFTVDTGLPETTIDTGIGEGTTTSVRTQTLTFSGGGTGATYQCKLNTGNYAACNSGSFTATNLTDGTYTFSVFTTDRAGNVDPSPATRTFTVDGTPPNTQIDTGPPSGALINANPTYTFSDLGTGAVKYQCAIDNGAFADCPSPQTVTGLADGTHTFSVRAVDAAGNVDASPASRTFTLDRQPPQTAIDSGPGDNTTSNNRNPSFTFSGAGLNGTYQCQVDTGPLTACTSPQPVGPLADGPHQFLVVATDAAGNVDPSPETRTFTVDGTAPETAITAPANNSTVGTPTPTISSTSTEPNSTFRCKVDNDPYVDCTASFTTRTLGNGQHTVLVFATDQYGNADQSPASVTFTVDTNVPDTTITSGPATGSVTRNTQPSFAFVGNKAGTFECSLDGAPFATCPSPFSPATPLSEAQHTFAVRLRDTLGNPDPTPDTRTFTVDTTPPVTSIDSGPSATTNDPKPTFAFSGAGDNGTYQCKLDNDPAFACSTPYTTPTLTEGSHTFTVTAIDAAGNVDGSPEVRTFVVDLTAPVTAIDSGPADNSSTNDTTPTFAFSGAGQGGRYECKVDGGQYAPCTSPFEVPTLGEGSHMFYVRAIDAAGNPDGTPEIRTFTVDVTPPNTAFTSTPPTPTTDQTPTFAFNSPDATATFECRIDGGAYATCKSPQDLGPLDDGPHTFDVRAVDPAGNADQSPASYTFTVDAGAPNTTVAGPTGPINDNTPTWTFTASEPGSTFECKLDDGLYTACTPDYTPNPALSDGQHTFSVRAVDPSGNRDGSPATRTVIVDTKLPDTTITGPPADGETTTDATPTFTLGSDETGVTFACSVDGAAYAPCPASFTTDSLANGPHTLQAIATDAAGNADASPAKTTFTVATTAPETISVSGPNSPASDPTATFEFTSDDPAATFECRLDGGEWAVCKSPVTTLPLADGKHTLDVRAVDAAGNKDQTPLSYEFVVETSEPDTAVAGPTGTISDNTPTFTFSSNKANVRYECRLDGAGAFAPCSTPATLSALADGPHTLEVRAIDNLGHTDSSPATISFTVRTAAAGTLDTTVKGAVTNGSTTDDTTPTFTFTSTDGKATFECRIDGGEWAACSNPFTAPELTAGEHTLRVRAKSADGKVDTTPVVIKFTVTGTVTPPADEDLSTIPGSLIAADKCQKIGGTGRVLNRRPRGFGKVRVRLQGNATAPPGTPLYVTVLGSRSKLRGVSYTLDGRPVAASRRGLYTLALAPSALAAKKRHVVTVRLRSRAGTFKTIKLRFKTLRCDLAYTVSQSRRVKGSLLRLRIDALRSLSTVSFGIPKATLRKASLAVLRVRTSGAKAKKYTLRKQGSTFVGTTAPITVAFTRSRATISGLPASAGIVRLNVRTLAKPVGSKGRTRRLRARVVTGGAPKKLKAKLTAKRVKK